jgi:DNA-binding GntR family transcriptional regulator
MVSPHGLPSPLVSYGDGKMDDLDRDSPVPLYEQLAALLRGQIERGELTGRVPSEPTLVQQYGVARGTAGRAVQILVDQGLVRYSSGKGAFVIPPGERRKK